MLKQDFERWCTVKGKEISLCSFVLLFWNYREFRTIVYYRLKHKGRIAKKEKTPSFGVFSFLCNFFV